MENQAYYRKRYRTRCRKNNGIAIHTDGRLSARQRVRIHRMTWRSDRQ